MILKNGKRLDGCSDTVPVGTLNPFLGSVAPYGYLICEGQLVSKTTYKELYEICGDTFGTGTATEFRLPDLRGKTIAGYKEGDTLFGILGKLIGSENHNHNISHTHGVPGVAHTHTTGNHTLTADEIPRIEFTVPHIAGTEDTRSINTGNVSSEGSSYYEGASNSSIGKTIKRYRYSFGGSGTHNHGDTSSTTPAATTTNSQSTTTSGNASNIQPTVVMNWIIKAFLLMPNQSYVENSLSSLSEINALSAAKGKELNDKIEERLPIHGVFTNNLDEAVEYPIYRSSVNPAGLPSYLSSNACMVLSSTNNSLYCGQLAFSFGSNSLALRRRYGTTTWTDWAYLNFDSVNNHLKDHGGCTITGGNITVTYPSTAWQIMKFTGFTNIVNSNTDLFSLSSGGVKILKAGYYCVSATLEGDFNRPASIVICKNDKEVSPLIDGGNVGGMYNITCPNVVIKADANDVIYVYTRCDTSNASILIRGERSCLTVTTI